MAKTVASWIARAIKTAVYLQCEHEPFRVNHRCHPSKANASFKLHVFTYGVGCRVQGRQASMQQVCIPILCTSLRTCPL
eukprot:2222738-Pleurochrysis_carterae.AAC.1